MYPHKEIEKKWQEFWNKEHTFEASEDPIKEKRYIMNMFPYPSADGLHVGHPRSYTATDIMARYARMKGYNVLFPVGWDAFGLPAENFAIKKGIHPNETTQNAIANFRSQVQSLGFSYDWSKEIDTSSPEYYKWTQWLFLQLYKKGLAYKAEAPVNWCEHDQTVLANEQVVGGVCERCKNPVIQKNLSQWFFKVTEYADELLKDLDQLDWPESIKITQRNWIGKKEGAHITFRVTNAETPITVFTTRPDTLFGVTYIVLAPEHPLLETLSYSNKDEVAAYQAASKKKSELERTHLSKEKTGVRLEGVTVVNPANNQEVPVYVADYVLAQYGTGAVMAVPAHDERDAQFAAAMSLPLIHVIEPITGTVHENEEPRNSVGVIIENKKNNTFLCINWGELGGTLFIGGGRDEGEDVIQTALREIKEETGYTNLRYVDQTPLVHHHYIAHSKNNAPRYVKAVFIHFELVDDTQEETHLEEDEKGKFTVEWLTAQQVEQRVKDELHRYGYETLIKKNAYAGEGFLTNSGQFDGMPTEQARNEITNAVNGSTTTTYRLRDWLVSRQRYWGAPIPIIYCETCGTVPVPEIDLPVTLPTDVDFRPTGESPLQRSETFQQVKCPTCDNPARRESDTMDTFVCSSWYYLRYPSAHNNDAAFEQDKLDYWMPVDLYVGGAEHAVLHLLYSRFVTKALRDMSFVKFDEPFPKLRNQGMIQGEDGEKMSKSRGNVINPDDVTAEYGADSLRLYEMFLGPLGDAMPWSTRSIAGVRRFLDKAWMIVERSGVQEIPEKETNPDVTRLMHKTIKKVTHDIEAMAYNTAISTMMVCATELGKQQASGTILGRETLESFILLLSPIAPHISEELWSMMGHTESLAFAAWPTYDESLTKEETIPLIIQINGKTRSQIQTPADISEDDAKTVAMNDEAVKKYTKGKEIKKVIYVPGRLINIVV